jgi:hypothetical protein
VQDSPTVEEASMAAPEPEPGLDLPVEAESTLTEAESVPDTSTSNGDAGSVEDWVRELEAEAAMEAEAPKGTSEDRSDEGPPRESVPADELEPVG